MQIRETTTARWAHRAALAVAVVVLIGSARGQANQGRGPVEGIAVHGHWTIEVRGPDGTLVKRSDFDNALVRTDVNSGITGGDLSLATLLARQGSGVEWSVRLHSALVSPCSLWPQVCVIEEPSDRPPEVAPFKTLQVLASSPWDALVLSGTMTADRAGQIDRVSTTLSLSPTQSAYFTEAMLPSVIEVVAGQIVQVTVRFTFS